MSLGVSVGLCSDGRVSHLRMSLSRNAMQGRGYCYTAVALKRHEGVNAFNLVTYICVGAATEKARDETEVGA